MGFNAILIETLTDVHSASGHFQMEYFMNLKDINIVNMIFMFYLHHAVANVVRVILKFI